MTNRFMPVDPSATNFTDDSIPFNATEVLGDTAFGQGLKALAESGILNFLMLYASHAINLIVSSTTNTQSSPH